MHSNVPWATAVPTSLHFSTAGSLVPNSPMPQPLPARLGGSLMGGGGLSLGGGGRGPERPLPELGAAGGTKDRFLWGSRGISSLLAGPGGTGGGPGLLGGGGGAGTPRGGRGEAGTGGLLFCGGGGGRAMSRLAVGRCPEGGGGGGGFSSTGERPGVGGSGGLPENGVAGPGPGCRRDPADPVARLPGNGGGVGPRLGWRLRTGAGAEPRPCRLEAMGRGVLGTGGGVASGLEPTSGLGGGRRLLWGSAAGLRCPSGGPGKRGGPLGAENGLAAAERAPGGSAGGRAAPVSVQEEERDRERASASIERAFLT